VQSKPDDLWELRYVDSGWMTVRRILTSGLPTFRECRVVAQIEPRTTRPTTSEILRSYGLSIDLEASHPKTGVLVKEAAEQSEALVQRNRSRCG
jgi:hypothetical protein